MVQTIQKIERSVRERRDADVPLTNYWLVLLLLNGITLGIYSLVLYFKRIGRVDKFIARKRDYYREVIEYTERKAKEKKKDEELHYEIQDLRDLYQKRFYSTIGEIGAGLSLALMIITCGLWGFYVLYRENKAWAELQNFERDFDDKLSQVWVKMDLIKYALSFNTDPKKNRSYFGSLILSVVTFGIWGIIWRYQIHTDPDNLYKEFHDVEDTVLNTVRG